MWVQTHVVFHRAIRDLWTDTGADSKRYDPIAIEWDIASFLGPLWERKRSEAGGYKSEDGDDELPMSKTSGWWRFRNVDYLLNPRSSEGKSDLDEKHPGNATSVKPDAHPGTSVKRQRSRAGSTTSERDHLSQKRSKSSSFPPHLPASNSMVVDTEKAIDNAPQIIGSSLADGGVEANKAIELPSSQLAAIGEVSSCHASVPVPLPTCDEMIVDTNEQAVNRVAPQIRRLSPRTSNRLSLALSSSVAHPLAPLPMGDEETIVDTTQRTVSQSHATVQAVPAGCCGYT